MGSDRNPNAGLAIKYVIPIKTAEDLKKPKVVEDAQPEHKINKKKKTSKQDNQLFGGN